MSLVERIFQVGTQFEQKLLRLPILPPKGWLLGLILRLANEQWSFDGENQVPYYHRFFSRAENTILLVTSGLNSESIERISTLKLLATKVHQGVTLETILGGVEASSPQEAEEAIQQDFPGLLEIKQKFSDRMRVYWLQNLPSVNFSIVDSKHTLMELDEEQLPYHIPGTPLPLMVNNRNQEFAIHLVDRFNRTKELTQEITT